MKSTRYIILACLAALLLTGGCSWVGRTAGKAEAKMERKAQSVEDGYREGYETEKEKTAPANK